MIPALDPDPGSDFQIFGNSGSGFGPSKKQNRNTYKGFLILALDADSE